VSPYALSKATADVLAQLAHESLAIDVVRTRSFGHTGPGQTTRFVIPAIADQVASIEAHGGEPVVRVGNLEVVRDLTDVREVVEAYLALLERGRPGAAYNVCRGEGARLADLASFLVARARVPIRIEVDPARFRPADVPYLVGDPGRIAAEVGWRARIPLEQTLADVLEQRRGAMSP
jgi:GDP-4-dehydro-6-deoxy-D-mannose reductase